MKYIFYLWVLFGLGIIIEKLDKIIIIITK